MRTTFAVLTIAALAVAAPAGAMTHGSGRAPAADPDAGGDRLADAVSGGFAAGSARAPHRGLLAAALRNDPNMREALLKR